MVLNIATTYADTGSALRCAQRRRQSRRGRPHAQPRGGVGRPRYSFVAIAPGAIRTEGAFSRLLPTPELEKELLAHNPLHRFGTLEEIANLGAFLISDQAGYINGEMVYMDGGEMLAGSSTFSMIGSRIPDAAWERMKPRKAKPEQ